MPFWTIIALQAATAAGTFDLSKIPRPADIDTLSVIRHCDKRSAGEDIVVCGRTKDRYRLPLPAERESSDARAPGEAPDGMATLTSAARCGIFAGERRCSKREAALYGYGGGRDRITVVTKLVKTAADPDVD